MGDAMSRSITRILCGISDEAASSIDTQLDAHEQLGWSQVELRTIDGVPASALPDDRFDNVLAAVRRRNMTVPVLDTGIGGWHRPIAAAAAAADHDELGRAADRAHRLGSRFLRIMSSPNAGLIDTEWKTRALDHLDSLVRQAASLDVVLLHENCQGWASQCAANTIEMMRVIDSPHLRLLLDTGNSVVHGQDPVAFARMVAPWVEHVHVKDVRQSGDGTEFTFPGEGDARVSDVLDILFQAGFSGVLSIEPHLAFIPHLEVSASPMVRLQVYVEYGRRFQRFVAQVLGTETSS
jgi:L-ribulose-5-phosphate 3-epimerase